MSNKEQPETYRCIYCLTENPKNTFNKEHVLHKSFGKFKRALTLTREVCESCNTYFGKNTDRILGRDSFEALLRLRYGIKPSGEYSDVSYKRLTITIPEGQGDWTGVKLAYQHPSVHLLPQLGFPQKNSRDYIYFTLQEIEKGLQLDSLNVDKRTEVKIISKTKEEYDKLTSFLKKIDIPFGQTREFSPVKLDDGRLHVKVKFIVDDIIIRGIAKIGFNYMTKMCGAAFTLKEDFNIIRQFIRYGKLSPELRETFQPSNQPLLANDDFNHRRLGHILLLEWDITRSHVLARVSPFNSVVWTIIMAKNFSAHVQGV